MPKDVVMAGTAAIDPVVVLVHGTFARNAQWTKAGGSLYDRLVQMRCKVNSFQWSGKNSHYARRLAVSQLTQTLGKLQEENPEAPLWVIAHSHGGNIAIHAGQEIWKKDPDQGRLTVVTLATPFIHARIRRRPAMGQGILFLAALICTFYVLGAWIFVAMEGLGTWPSWHRWVPAIFAMLVGLSFLAVILLSAQAAWRYRKEFGARFGERIVESTHAPTVVRGQVIAIRAAGDEATGTLTVGQFLSGLSAMAARRFFSVGTERMLGLFVIGSMVVIVQGLVVAAGLVPPSLRSSLARLAFWVLFNVFLPTFCVMGAVLLLMCAASLVFGSDGPLVGAFASCSTEASPPGEPETYQLPPFVGLDRPKQGRLNHSRLYEYGPVIDRIAGLVGDRDRASRTPGAGGRTMELLPGPGEH